MKEERKDWCRLPYALLLDERLTTADAVVYAVLSDVLHDGRTDIKIADIVKLTGVPIATTKRSLDKLEEAGYIISRRTDGRRLFIELAQVLPTLKSKKKEQHEAPAPLLKQVQSRDETLKSTLAKKIKVKRPEYVDGVYAELKAQAEASVKDKSKTLAYLSKMISNYVDNSDGFDPEEYEGFMNIF